MSFTFAEFLAWIIVLALTWPTVFATLAIASSDRSRIAKSIWITFVVCTPLIGPVTYLILGNPTPAEDLATREARIKARLNAAAINR